MIPVRKGAEEGASRRATARSRLGRVLRGGGSALPGGSRTGDGERMGERERTEGRVSGGGGRMRLALGLTLGGGLLLATAFPPYGIWPLAPLGPALLAVALRRGTFAPRRGSLRASFGVGLVFGVAFFFPLLSWTVNVAWYAWVALAGAEAVILGVLAIGQRLLLRTRAWPVAVAGWWVAAEALRDRWPWGGFPWGRLAMSQAGAPTQGWAAIGGTPLLTFVIALAGTVLAWSIERAVAAGRPAGTGGETAAREPGGTGGEKGTGRLRTLGTGRRGGIVVAGAVLAAVAGVAVAPAAFTLDPVAAGGGTAEIAAIQGNVPRQRTLAAQLNDTMVTANHARATLELARTARDGKAPKPDLVIWPENSTDIDPSLDPQIYAEITQATSAIGVPVLVGAVLQNPTRNAGQLWVPGKGPTQVYLKRRLVPFGEVIPFRGILEKITSLTALQPSDFTPGRENVVFRVGNIRLGDVICYEIGFDDLVRSDVAAGANLLAMQTNDATFERDGQTGETGQQLAMARLRAVEHDRAVVVASTTGYSAIVAPDGRMITKSGTWRQAILRARIPLVTRTTLADRVGPWPEYAIVILTAAAVAHAAIAGASRKRGASALN